MSDFDLVRNLDAAQLEPTDSVELTTVDGGRFWKVTHNAAPNQPRHHSGRYLPHGAGTGRGPAHEGAQVGHGELLTTQPLTRIGPDRMVEAEEEDDHHEDDAPGTPVEADDHQADVDTQHAPKSLYNANPEGHNQYTGAAKVAAKEASAASGSTNKRLGAHQATKEAGSRSESAITPEEHEAAASAHSLAGMLHGEKATELDSTGHAQASAKHHEAAAAHSRAADEGHVAAATGSARTGGELSLAADDATSKAYGNSKTFTSKGTASRYAASYGAKGNSKVAAVYHRKAAKEHEEALKTATGEDAAKHFDAQQRHSIAADFHEEHTTNADPKGHNQYTGGGTMNKRGKVEYLVANCSCWGGEGDGEILNALPEEKLGEMCDDCRQKALIVNAATNAVVLPEGFAVRVNPDTGAWERKEVENSNPEGHNQYSKGASQSSVKTAAMARHASNEAIGASQRASGINSTPTDMAEGAHDKAVAGDHAGAADFHDDISIAHGKEADRQIAAGNKEEWKAHSAASLHHREAAEANRAAAKKPTSNAKRKAGDDCPGCGKELTQEEVDDDECEDCGEDLTENAFQPPQQGQQPPPPRRGQQPEPPPPQLKPKEKGVQASKEAAMATLDTGDAGKAREKAFAAMDAAKDDPEAAQKTHLKAASYHEKAATASRRSGEDEEADAHDQAAAMHRKAASCHEAVQNGATFNELMENCGGKGGTRGPCKGGGSTGKAVDASAKVSAGEKSGKSAKNIAKLHDAAKEAHEDAAATHRGHAGLAREQGNEAVAKAHEAIADKHEKAAGEHADKAKATGQPALRGGLENREQETHMKRTRAIDTMIANGKATERDRNALLLLSEAAFNAIESAEAAPAFDRGGKAKAPVQAGGTGLKTEYPENGDEDDDDDEEDSEMEENARPARNTRMTREEREVYELGRRTLLQNRRRLVDQLKAIAEATHNDRKRALICNKLASADKLTTDALEQLVVMNSEPESYAGNSVLPDEPDPLYLGSAAPVGNSFDGTPIDRTAVLPEVKLDWAEISRNHRHGGNGTVNHE